MTNLELIMAEHQLTGYCHATRGGTIKQLIEDMGLTQKEWEKLKSADKIPFMRLSEIEEIDQYFYDRL